MKMNEKIKQLRLQRGLTLEQVGDYVGVGKATVLKWENGFIQNMRRDKIAKLARVLGTTPDFLIGWESAPDEWTKTFCESVESQLASSDPLDIAESGIDYYRLSEVASGVNSISLSEACNIADELGCSLDEMVGKETSADENKGGRVEEFVELFQQLTKEQQMLVISSIKGILSNQ